MLSPESRGRMSFGSGLGILVVLQALAVLPFLGAAPLSEVDEARIAQISREMAESGDWIVPRLGGEPYACYPPLAYWLMAGSGIVFGFGEFAMRLPSALAGLALTALAGRVGRRLAGDGAGLAAAAVLATMHAFVLQQASCRADVLVALGAVGAFERFLAVAGGAGAKGWLPFPLWLALGVLAKGPIAGVVCGMGIAAWLLVERRWRVLLDLKPALTVPLFLAATVPWYLLAGSRAGAEFLRTNLLLENFAAFTTGHEQAQPAWFYLRTAPQRLVPWLLLLPAAWAWKGERGFRTALLWAAGVFLFLSVSSAKRVNYLTFVYPAFATAVGIGLAATLRAEPRRISRGIAIVAGLAAAAGLAIGILGAAGRGSSSLRAAYPAAPILLLAAAAVLAVVLRAKGPLAATVSLGAAVLLLIGAYHGTRGLRLEESTRQALAFCTRVETSLPPREPVSLIGPELPEGFHLFYCRRPVLRRSTPGPGYYLGNEAQKSRLVDSTPGALVLDAVPDDRGHRTYLIRVNP